MYQVHHINCQEVRLRQYFCYQVRCFQFYKKDKLKKLGKHKTGKSCLYIKSLKDIDKKVLKEMIVQSVKETKKLYPDDK